MKLTYRGISYTTDANDANTLNTTTSEYTGTYRGVAFRQSQRSVHGSRPAQPQKYRGIELD